MGYDFELSLDENTSVGAILKYVKPGSRILEFGCAYGRMTAYMQRELSCAVSIVEKDADAYGHARKYAADGLCDDIMDYRWTEYFQDVQFDHIIFADVLEHLYDPAGVLHSAKKLLKDSGSVLLSVPNIAHNDVIANLFGGQFEYTQYGLLDRTHIRFFTGEMLDEFCKNAGYAIVGHTQTILETNQTEQCAVRKQEISILLKNLLDARKNGTVYQYILKLQKSECAENRTVSLLRDSFRNPPFLSVYYGKESRFCEENKCLKQVCRVEGEKHVVAVTLSLEDPVDAVRIDPVEGQPCIIENLEAEMENGEVSIPDEAMKSENGLFLMNGNDPQLIFYVKNKGKGILTIRFDFYLQGETYIQKLQDIAGKLAECRRYAEQVNTARKEAERHIKSLDAEIEYYIGEHVNDTLELEQIKETYESCRKECEKRQAEIETMQQAVHTMERQAEDRKHRIQELEQLISQMEQTKRWRMGNWCHTLLHRMKRGKHETG